MTDEAAEPNSERFDSGYAGPGYAGPGLRAVQLFIQISVMSSVCLLSTAVALLAWQIGGATDVAIAAWVTTQLGLSAVFVMSYCRRVATTGQWWSHRAAGVMLVDETTGDPVSSWRLLARGAASSLSALSLGIGYLMVFVDNRRQTWHDKIARTVVVEVPRLRPFSAVGRAYAPAEFAADSDNNVDSGPPKILRLVADEGGPIGLSSSSRGDTSATAPNLGRLHTEVSYRPAVASSDDGVAPSTPTDDLTVVPVGSRVTTPEVGDRVQPVASQVRSLGGFLQLPDGRGHYFRRKVVVGRAPAHEGHNRANAFQIAHDVTMSRAHVRFRVEADGTVFAEDLDSSNGTLLIGPMGTIVLRSGVSVEVPEDHVVEIGETRLSVTVQWGSAARPSPPRPSGVSAPNSAVHSQTTQTAHTVDH